MIRIKKKFLLAIFIVVFFVYLYFYLYSNVPTNSDKFAADVQKPIPNSHKRPRSHVQNVLDKSIDDDLNENDNLIGGGGEEDPEQTNLEKKDLLNDQILPENSNTDAELSCNLDVESLPNVDVQMLDAYSEIPFDNVDGGVWKQGWNIEYDIHQWNRNHKLKVFVVPHSHNDPGWINTFDEYYERQTKHIFSNMLRHLDENEGMKFIWAEIVYFARWYDSLVTPESKEKVKRLIKRKQLEFVTGGWVMPDEAGTHWYSVLQSLTEGQLWLKKAFNISNIKSSWAIDPFGHSSVMPYILKEAGFENLLIQRTHYSVKKYLGQHKQLEFRWRQLWDTKGTTDLFTHMMPFYSYDIPHTCGPDPKICCQFDFKRLPGYGLSCPWKAPPVPINDDNVAKRAEMVIDQWRKKSMLYKTRSVLIPLGDDFRYTQSMEWESQRVNFEKLFEHINNEPSLNVEVKFATLQEYFDSVRHEKGVSQFPSLAGDFFTYADRDDHYWSGYFTSRPFYKRTDRILMNYLRTAEMLHSWTTWEKSTGFEKRLEQARRALAIFQHHDGVPGTAKDYVMNDYNDMMMDGIKNSKFVIQQAVYKLLTESNIYHPDYSFTYFNIDDSRAAASDDSTRSVIIIGDEIPHKYVVIHNSQTYLRNEVVEFFAARPFICVTDADGNSVDAQVTPAISWHKGIYQGLPQPSFSTTKYRLIFTASVPALGLSVYKLNAKNKKDECPSTTYSQITIFTDNQFDINLDDYPEKVTFAEPRETSLRINENSPGASFNKYGVLKSLSQDSKSPVVPVHLEFMKYGTRMAHGQRSGAYLFLPDGPAQKLEIKENPTVVISNGQLEASITSGLPFVIHESILRSGGDALEIRNAVDIRDTSNTEVVMRLSTNIKNDNVFYTDLNGMQYLKRKILKKIPLQGNYYPVPAGIFIEDDAIRLSLFTSAPLGGSSLSPGEIEIMQDRRLNQDDERGLGQGVTDNKPVMNILKLVLESRESCKKNDERYPMGFLTATAFMEQKKLLHPFEKLIFAENDWNGVKHSFGNDHEDQDVGFEIVAMRTLPHIRTNAIGLVVHRTNFDKCSADISSMSGNQINIKRLLGLDENEESREIYRSHITLLEPQQKVNEDAMGIAMCGMDIKGFILK